jgi:hypothetical protein
VGANPLAKNFVSTGKVECKDKQALESALAIGRHHILTTIELIKGTDLLAFRCYGDTPTGAKKNAESLVKKLRSEAARRIARENGKDVKANERAAVANKYYVFHDLIFPDGPLSNQEIEQPADGKTPEAPKPLL